MQCAEDNVQCDNVLKNSKRLQFVAKILKQHSHRKITNTAFLSQKLKNAAFLSQKYLDMCFKNKVLEIVEVNCEV